MTRTQITPTEACTGAVCGSSSNATSQGLVPNMLLEGLLCFGCQAICSGRIEYAPNKDSQTETRMAAHVTWQEDMAVQETTCFCLFENAGAFTWMSNSYLRNRKHMLHNAYDKKLRVERHADLVRLRLILQRRKEQCIVDGGVLTEHLKDVTADVGIGSLMALSPHELHEVAM